MRLYVGIVCAACFVLAACGSADGDGEAVAGNAAAPVTGETVSTVAPLEPEPEEEPQEAEVSRPENGSDVSLEFSCDKEGSVDGDFDSDGTIDQAYFDESLSSLVVCTDAGDQVLEVGRLEILTVSDVDLDGSDEILAGGTSAWGQGVEIVSMVDGQLGLVADPDGEPLALWQGLPPDRVLASGCGSFSGSGNGEVAILDGTVSNTSVEWQRTVYRIDGLSALEVLSDTGMFDLDGSRDPLTSATIKELVGEPC